MHNKKGCYKNLHKKACAAPQICTDDADWVQVCSSENVFRLMWPDPANSSLLQNKRQEERRGWGLRFKIKKCLVSAPIILIKIKVHDKTDQSEISTQTAPLRPKTERLTRKRKKKNTFKATSRMNRTLAESNEFVWNGELASTPGQRGEWRTARWGRRGRSSVSTIPKRVSLGSTSHSASRETNIICRLKKKALRGTYCTEGRIQRPNDRSTSHPTENRTWREGS